MSEEELADQLWMGDRYSHSIEPPAPAALGSLSHLKKSIVPTHNIFSVGLSTHGACRLHYPPSPALAPVPTPVPTPALAAALTSVLVPTPASALASAPASVPTPFPIPVPTTALAPVPASVPDLTSASTPALASVPTPDNPEKSPPKNLDGVCRAAPQNNKMSLNRHLSNDAVTLSDVKQINKENEGVLYHMPIFEATKSTSLATELHIKNEYASTYYQKVREALRIRKLDLLIDIGQYYDKDLDGYGKWVDFELVYRTRDTLGGLVPWFSPDQLSKIAD